MNLNEFFLEWEMFQTDDVAKIKTRFMFNKYFLKNRADWDNVEKYRTARQDTDDKTILYMRIACRVN